METKKVGFVVMGVSIALGFLIFGYMGQLNAYGQKAGCNPTQDCKQVNSMLGFSHAIVGFLSFLFSLGFYLLFFNRSEKELMEKYSLTEKISKDGPKKEENDKFSLLLRPLDDNEKKILLSIREQEGITQSTLRFRANLSKAKVSQILTDFEKKSLIERKAKGKTYQVFLADNYDS